MSNVVAEEDEGDVQITIKSHPTNIMTEKPVEGSEFTFFTSKESINDNQKSYFISKRASNIFLKVLPLTSYDSEDLARSNLAFPAFTVFSLSWLIIFTLYFSLGVQKYLGSTFLSLTGTSEFQNCNPVPITISGSYELDMFGRWSTDPLFLRNSSIFRVSFHSSAITMEDYLSTMRIFQQRVIDLDAVLSTHDVTHTAVAWSTFFVEDKNTLMSIRTTADWYTIFSNYYRMSSSSRGYSNHSGYNVIDDCMANKNGVKTMNQPVVSSSSGIVNLDWALTCTNSESTCGWDQIVQVLYIVYYYLSLASTFLISDTKKSVYFII
jgi:hypothetical protein